MKYQAKLITRLGIRTYDEKIMRGLMLEATREDDEFRYDHKESISGKVTFTDAADYALFYTIETTLEIRDEPIYFIIYQWCGGEWLLKRSASISMRDGEWDADKCTVSFKLIVDEKYKAWDDNKSTKLNLFAASATRYSTEHAVITGTIHNGIHLYEALRYAFRQFYPAGDIRSEFLGFNPDNPSTVLTHANYQTLLLFQNSDIIRRSLPGYTPATGMSCTLDELVTNICKLFNLVYRIDHRGDLRIDPLEFFQNVATVGLDLTTAPHEIYTRRLNHWAYQNEKIYSKEVFHMANENPHIFYNQYGYPIIYDNGVTKGLQNTDKVITVSFAADVAYLASLSPSGDTDLEGICIVAVTIVTGTETEIVEETNPALTFNWAGSQANNVMQWPLLQEQFHLDNRLFKYGIMNLAPRTFNSTQRIRIQRSLKTLICCEVWNALDLVTSGLGDGEVSAYKYDFLTGTVEMDLLFPVPDTNTIAIPTAEDDYFHVAMNTTLYGVGLTTNDTGVISVLVESKNTAAAGWVEIDASGNFTYTPPDPSFYGQDSFQYTIIGANGYTDTATAYIGVRWPDIYVRENTVTAQWFKDAAGTQPLNVSGFGMDLLYLEAYSLTNQSTPAEGYSQPLGYIYDAVLQQYTYDAILPSSDYTII